MQEKNSDIFELNKSNNKFGHLLSDSDKNPFVHNSVSVEHLNRLNDFDSNILRNGAYKNIPDDAFKLEYKISKIEEDIKAIKIQIHTAQEMDDFDRITGLQNELNAKKESYKLLLDAYNEMTLSAKITDSFSNIFGNIWGTKIKSIKAGIKLLCNIIISKMPAKLSSTFKIKRSLLILENINKNVDSLISTNTPLGENRDKYNQLSKYIIKANSIQSEISDFLKKN